MCGHVNSAWMSWVFVGVVVTLGTHNSVCMQIFEFLFSLDHTIISIFPEFICLHHGKTLSHQSCLGPLRRCTRSSRKFQRSNIRPPMVLWISWGFSWDFMGISMGSLEITLNYGWWCRGTWKMVTSIKLSGFSLGYGSKLIKTYDPVGANLWYLGGNEHGQQGKAQIRHWNIWVSDGAWKCIPSKQIFLGKMMIIYWVLGHPMLLILPHLFGIEYVFVAILHQPAVGHPSNRGKGHRARGGSARGCESRCVVAHFLWWSGSWEWVKPTGTV